jgi:hypothetical protein
MSSNAGGFWNVDTPPVDDGFWTKATVQAVTWVVDTPPVDDGFWTPHVGARLDINFVLDESRLG